MTRRLPSLLAALALCALACQQPPATPERRVAMGPEIVAHLARKKIPVKVNITGPQSEEITVTSDYMGDQLVETMAYRGILNDICHAGFKKVLLTDGAQWHKNWKC